MADDQKLDVSQVEDMVSSNDLKADFVAVRQMSTEERKHLEKKLLRKLDTRLMCTVGRDPSPPRFRYGSPS